MTLTRTPDGRTLCAAHQQVLEGDEAVAEHLDLLHCEEPGCDEPTPMESWRCGAHAGAAS